MSKPVSFLYSLARMAWDIKKIKSGDPKKGAGGVKNKVISRNIIRKFWRLRSFLKLSKGRKGIKQHIVVLDYNGLSCP